MPELKWLRTLDINLFTFYSFFVRSFVCNRWNNHTEWNTGGVRFVYVPYYCFQWRINNSLTISTARLSRQGSPLTVSSSRNVISSGHPIAAFTLFVICALNASSSNVSSTLIKFAEGFRWYTIFLPHIFSAITSSLHQGETDSFRRFVNRERHRSHKLSTGSQHP